MQMVPNTDTAIDAYDILQHLHQIRNGVENTRRLACDTVPGVNINRDIEGIMQAKPHMSREPGVKTNEPLMAHTSPNKTLTVHRDRRTCS